MVRARAIVAVVAPLALTLSACASAPNRQPAVLPTTEARFVHASSVAPVDDGAWWTQFGDTVLVSLVERAVAANLDLRIALERTAAARAGSRIQASRLLPTVGVQAVAVDERAGLPAEIERTQPDIQGVRAAIDLAWEVDLAGGLRAAHRASRADWAATAADTSAARLLIAGEVGRQYFILRGAQERLRIVEQLAAAQRDTDRLIKSREREGLASRFDVSRSSAEAESLDAQVPPLRTLVGVTQSRMAVLLGEDPSRFAVENRAFTWPTRPNIGAGQPSELLRRRPDLMAAEARFAAETLRVREARAQWWPKLFVSALAGRQALRLGGLGLSSFPFANVALTFAQPLFNGGRIQAAVAIQSARANEALAAWQRAVLVAIEEVENGLLVRREEATRGELLTSALAARRQSLTHAQSLHREGQIDLLVLLDVQRALLAAELDLTHSRTQQALNDVLLYRSLGGGWASLESIAAAAIPQEARP